MTKILTVATVILFVGAIVVSLSASADAFGGHCYGWHPCGGGPRIVVAERSVLVERACFHVRRCCISLFGRMHCRCDRVFN